MISEFLNTLDGLLAEGCGEYNFAIEDDTLGVVYESFFYCEKEKLKSGILIKTFYFDASKEKGTKEITLTQLHKYLLNASVSDKLVIVNKNGEEFQVKKDNCSINDDIGVVSFLLNTDDIGDEVKEYYKEETGYKEETDFLEDFKPEDFSNNIELSEDMDDSFDEDND